MADGILDRFGATSRTPLGSEYYFIKTSTPAAIRQSEASLFARWNLPVEHSWPCNPQKMEGFIEKAAQTLWKKFGSRNPQQIIMGQLNAGSPDKYYKGLASNLRGRTLQLFPKLPVADVESQASETPTLFCMLGKEGLFAGMQSPKACNGFYAGGSKYAVHQSPDTISRAGAKIAEALHYLLLYRPPIPAGSRWLELGACPGGMTSELLTRNYQVTAIDRAALDTRLDHQPGLEFFRTDVALYQPAPETVFDALLSDLNGEPEESMAHITRLSKNLKPGGLVVFTLKSPKLDTLSAPLALRDDIVRRASRAGLRLFAQTHLTYNRHEFTLFFEKDRPRPVNPNRI
jgi:hypothetical protein